MAYHTRPQYQEQPNDEYILMCVEEDYSALNSTTMYRLHWCNINCPERHYETTIDSSYRNYRNWQAILTEPEPQLGVYSGLKVTARTTRRGHPVISADSRPRPVEVPLTAEVCQQLRAAAQTTDSWMQTQTLFTVDDQSRINNHKKD